MIVKYMTFLPSVVKALRKITSSKLGFLRRNFEIYSLVNQDTKAQASNLDYIVQEA